MEEASRRKRAKYADLVGKCRSRGWRTQYALIEAGCRGFAAQLLCRAFKLIGITALHRKRAIRNITDAAEKVPRWQRIKRGNLWTTHATWTGVGSTLAGSPGQGCLMLMMMNDDDVCKCTAKCVNYSFILFL